MAEKLKPCTCGYEGPLDGADHGTYLSTSCPVCQRRVEAFTVRGLVENWNRRDQAREP